MVSVALDQSVSMAAVRLELPLDKQVISLISWLQIGSKRSMMQIIAFLNRLSFRFLKVIKLVGSEFRKERMGREEEGRMEIRREKSKLWSMRMRTA